MLMIGNSPKGFPPQLGKGQASLKTSLEFVFFLPEAKKVAPGRKASKHTLPGRRGV